MFEIHVTIACPDLVTAARLLAKCTTPAADNTVALSPVPAAAPTAPVTPAPAVPVAPAVPSAPVTPPVPLAEAPTYTIQQIAKAGADLFSSRPDLQPRVNGLLASYGIQSVMDLKPEHFGAFATALRGLGAAI